MTNSITSADVKCHAPHATRHDTASSVFSSSLEGIWRETRRRAAVVKEWGVANRGEDLPPDLVDWSIEPLYEAGAIPPRSEGDWAALVLITQTLRPLAGADDVLDEIEERCCSFGLPVPGHRI